MVAAGAHKVLLFFALMTNTIVTAMLVPGSAAVVNALTSVHSLVAAFLIPIGVIICTFSGGLKATFFADYNSEIGGISGLFEKLVSLVSTNPVQGKAGGAYLTMAFTGALVFGIINIVGNFEQCLLIRHFGIVP